jgi:murein DD-endopeptidase MepM/ murein hydrolase activator NlpD
VGGDVNAEEAAAPEPDAEVAFVMRDLSSVLPQVKSMLTTPDDEVMARVREAAAWLKKSAERGPVAPDITGIKLAYAGVPNGTDPYAGFDVRIVPENITLLPKTAAQATGGNPVNEKTILVKKGDTVAGVLRDLGATPEEIGAVVGLLGSYGRDGGIKEGQKLRILMSPDPDSQHLQPVRVIVADDSAIRAVAALADTGKYVAVDPRNIDNEISEASDDTGKNASPTGVTLYQSVYETALRNNVPRPIIDDLIRMYSFDVDFDRKVQAGDYFEVLYAGNDDAPGTDSHNEVLFAMLTVGGETKRLYRFQSPDDGLVDYYDESGKSAKKFLVRKPVAAGIMRSGFGLRGHPILGYVKMHTGVDWAAPMGTPVYAAGNGVVEKEGWESGYGKFVMIRHTNGYETAYGHLSAYARGTQEGAHVRQGQVIGFIGSTGLSTGSHLHFEIRINGRFVDPMRVKLPRGRELHANVLASFEQERDRIDNILARKPARVATR